MEKLIFNLRAPVSRAKSREQDLIDQIIQDFGKMNYGLLMKCIKEKGFQFCGETYREVKKNPKVKDKKTYFLSIVLRTKLDP